MPPTPRHQAGFTWIELLVCLGVVGILVFLAMPTISCGPVSGQMTKTLSNMKQLHLATQQMALDGYTEEKPNLSWPGDTGGTYSNWAAQLVPTYLSTNDFCKLLSSPRRKVPVGKLPENLSGTALLLYAVREDSPGDAVFLSTANFTNTPSGGTYDDRIGLYANSSPGFVIFHKAGDGQVMLPKQAGKTNLIGSYVPLCH